MPLPCPGCRTPLGLDLSFIIKNPVSACPSCGIVMDFRVNEEIKDKFKEAISQIDTVKKKYDRVAKFKK
jgi:hypothetical protein